LSGGGHPKRRGPDGTRNAFGDFEGGDNLRGGVGPSSGGASRFFYCAKASKSERGKDNNHPTVKPLALMRYLCRLTATPTKGNILDPFLGSGTTGVAALMEGREFIGIEKSPEYLAIAERRIREQANNPACPIFPHLEP
jgi:DNA modification methylase